MALTKFIKSSTVNELIRKGFINKEGIRILDCSYVIPQKLDWKLFKEELYGKFDIFQKSPTPAIKLYLSGHIPEAVHMNLDAAVYPSKYERFTMYPPELFEEYIQLLGVNKKEHLILYSRGPLAGMMFAARCAWLFKIYGHDTISILDGGWKQWVEGGYDISFDNIILPRGNWKAVDRRKTHSVQFEELEEKDNNGKQFIEKTDEINFLDSRGRGQFEGTEETGLDPSQVNSTRIPGFKNCPASEIITKEGLVKNEEDIIKWLKSNGYDQINPTIINCNTGMTASFLTYAVEGLIEGTPRLYSGSLKEIELRSPKWISAGPAHIPH